MSLLSRYKEEIVEKGDNIYHDILSTGALAGEEGFLFIDINTSIFVVVGKLESRIVGFRKLIDEIVRREGLPKIDAERRLVITPPYRKPIKIGNRPSFTLPTSPAWSRRGENTWPKKERPTSPPPGWHVRSTFNQ